MMIMGGAFLIAIIVAMLVQMKLAPKAKPQEIASTSAEILVAGKDIAAGDVIKAEDVHWASAPDNFLFKGMIKRKDQADEKKLEIFGKPARREIAMGEPVTMQAVVADAGSGNFLAASLPPGMRAVAVPVKAETMAGGFIAPGDYVDVLMTYTLSLKGDADNYSQPTIQKYASETILSNVKVLAVDQDTKEGNHEVKVGRTVTLQVNKEQAQTLAMASTMGEISLTLRRFGEKDVAEDKDSVVTTDVSTSKVIQKIYDNMDKAKPAADSVRVYSGGTVTNIPVRPAAN